MGHSIIALIGSRSVLAGPSTQAAAFFEAGRTRWRVRPSPGAGELGAAGLGRFRSPEALGLVDGDRDA